MSESANTSRSSVRTNVAGAVRMAWEASPSGLLVAVALALIGAVIQPVLVLAGKWLVDTVALSETRAVGVSEVMPALVLLGVLATAQRIATAIQSTRQDLFARRVGLDAERRFLERAAAVDLGHFDSSDWHDRMSRARWDLDWRPALMTETLIGLLGSLVVLAGMGGVLLSLHPMLVGLTIASVLPSLLLQRRVNRSIYRFHFEWTPARREEQYLATMLSYSQNAKELRSFNLGGHFLDRHRRLALDRYDRQAALYRKAERVSVTASVLGGVALAAAYGFVAVRGIRGELSAGDLTALIGALAAITTQVGLVSASLLQMDQHSQFLDDYFSFLRIEELVVRPSAPKALPAHLDEHGISFDRVHFTYPGADEPALVDFTLDIRPGELIALVGENGAGKTSVVKLLERFYDPDAGTIRVGGIDVRDVDPEALRDRIGLLFQDYVNYELTARDSVIFGRADRTVDDDKVRAALEAARAEGVVKRLANGLDTNIGRMFEGGHDLSGGQWQRLALARLVYRDADIWILDEPTSALDPEAEAAIFAELRENLDGRIGIVISHRFSTVRIADRIAVIGDGRVTELGTHEELLARGGRYAQLFDLQAAGYR